MDSSAEAEGQKRLQKLVVLLANCGWLGFLKTEKA